MYTHTYTSKYTYALTYIHTYALLPLQVPQVGRSGPCSFAAGKGAATANSGYSCLFRLPFPAQDNTAVDAISCEPPVQQNDSKLEAWLGGTYV